MGWELAAAHVITEALWPAPAVVWGLPLCPGISRLGSGCGWMRCFGRVSASQPVPVPRVSPTPRGRSAPFLPPDAGHAADHPASSFRPCAEKFCSPTCIGGCRGELGLRAAWELARVSLLGLPGAPAPAHAATLNPRLKRAKCGSSSGGVAGVSVGLRGTWRREEAM